MPKRKAGGSHFSSMAWRIDRLPKRVRKLVFFETLLAFIDGDIEALPYGWGVSWGWRNAEDEEPWEHSDTFEETVTNSTSGFIDLMRRRLVRELEAVSETKPISIRKRKRGVTKHAKRRSKKRAKKTRRRQVSQVRQTEPKSKSKHDTRKRTRVHSR